MKKLFTYIAMVAAAVSCTMEDMYGPQQTPIEPIASEGIEVTVIATGDSTATFVLAPKGEATYYSYLVDMGDKAESLDSSAVFACTYEGVAAGTIKWTAAAPKDTITVKDLAPNTTYQIYAVAGSSIGIPSAVVNKSFKTSDKVAPTLMEYEAADSVVVLAFDEAVARGTGKVVAGIYAMNSAEIEKGNAVGSMEVADTCIQVSGNLVQIVITGLPAGAFYSINYPEGAFKDVSNNAVAALESTVTYGSDTKWEPVYAGVGGRNATSEWSFGDIPEGVTDWTAAITVVPETPYGIGYVYGSKLFSVEYKESVSKKTFFDLAYNKNYGLSQNGDVVVYLPEEPAKGTAITITIPEKTFEDYFGNINEEWSGTTTSLFDMEIPFDNIVGTYAMTEANGLTGKFTQTLTVIEASDNPVKGNVMLTAYYGYKANTAPIYGCYDPKAGTLTFAAQQIYAKVQLSETEYGYLMFTSNTVSSSGSVGIGSDPVVWYVPSANTIAGGNTYYGVVLLDSTEKVKSLLCVNFPDYTEGALVPQTETPAPSAVEFVTGFPMNSTIIR